jgi:hypothetical protein
MRVDGSSVAGEQQYRKEMAWRVAELFLPYLRSGISNRMLKKAVQQGRSE